MTDKPSTDSASPAAPQDEEEFSLVFKLLLHSLRILAAVPGSIGTFCSHATPGCLRRNTAICSVLAICSLLLTVHSNFGAQSRRSGRRCKARLALDAAAGSLDFAVACLWSMSTAYHALSFTTLLLRRWLLYYSILPSLIRLVALQAICWPLCESRSMSSAQTSLWVHGCHWHTTALSDVVSRWVTSNIAEAPLDDELDEEEAEEEAENEALGYLSDHRIVQSSRQSYCCRTTPSCGSVPVLGRPAACRRLGLGSEIRR